MKTMKTSYFTFGQSNAHSVSGFTYDKDIIVMVTAENPREKMFEYFGDKWAMEYPSLPDLKFFPRGVKELK